MWTAAVGMVILAVTAVLLPTWPPALTALMVFYTAAVDLYSVAALLRGAWGARGVARRRMQYAALGLGLLAVALVLAGILTLVPALVPATIILIEFVALFSGLAFYLGFAPPRPLRRAWQLTELEGFLSASADAPADASLETVLHRLAAAAVHGVGGRAAFVLAPPDWQVVVATDEPLAAALQPASQPVGFWESIAAGRARVVSQLDNWYQASLAARFKAEAQSTLAVPIKTAQSTWGVLVVLLRRGSLFPEDDIHLLELLKTQINAMIEQRSLIGSLRQQTHELELANQDLETANMEMEAFTYSVSHDLRTPLRHIEGFAQVLADAEAVTAAGRRPVENILAATARMAHLIDAMLALSRLGRADLTLTRVPLDTLVQQVRTELANEMRDRTVTWYIGALPTVTGDPVLLRQVFLNLLANALKYTRPRQDALIEISAKPGPANQVTVSVRDNGVGFDPAYSHRLFTVFQRLHHPNEFEGDGIGLANVRRIVQRHGGRAWAEGAVDSGATFYVSLPAESAPAPAAPPLTGRPAQAAPVAHVR
jgi:signal transduction histidine kinase